MEQLKRIPGTGVVHFAEWQIMPDGESYRYVWCKRWKIITDKMVPIEGFKSAERWALGAFDSHNNLLGLYPGCGVKGFTVFPEPPKRRQTIAILGSEE